MAGNVRSETAQIQLESPPSLALRLTSTGDVSAAPAVRSVRWAAAAVDNEGLGRRSSKRCCVFHKKRAFGDGEEDEGEGVRVAGGEVGGAGGEHDGEDGCEHSGDVREEHSHEHKGDALSSTAFVVRREVEGSDASTEKFGECEHCLRSLALEAGARERQEVARGSDLLDSVS